MISKIPKILYHCTLRTILDDEKKKWIASVKEYRWWVSSGQKNLFVAEALYEKYLAAHKKIEIKSSTFRGGEITDEENSWSQIHKTVLMFYGFAVECYVKALLIKNNKIEIFNSKNTYMLSEELLKHLFVVFNNNKDKLPEIDNEDEKHLKYLHRAILSGKYPFEKTPDEIHAYTGSFDGTVTFSKDYISKVEKLLNKALD